MPKHAFAFSFFDVEEIHDGEETLRGKPKNRSGMYYYGKVYTDDEAIAEAQKTMDSTSKHIFTSNVRINGYKKLIKTRMGNWQPLEDEDVVLGE